MHQPRELRDRERRRVALDLCVRADVQRPVKAVPFVTGVKLAHCYRGHDSAPAAVAAGQRGPHRIDPVPDRLLRRCEPCVVAVSAPAPERKQHLEPLWRCVGGGGHDCSKALASAAIMPASEEIAAASSPCISARSLPVEICPSYLLTSRAMSSRIRAAVRRSDFATSGANVSIDRFPSVVGGGLASRAAGASPISV